MSSNLKKSVASGVVWQVGGRYSALIVQFIVTIILARILTPADYGTIGILNVFIAISAILIDSGFGQALIQKGNPSRLDYSSVLYFNLALSIILYLALFALLPYISIFFNDPRLTDYGRLLFVTMLIDAFSIVQNTKLQQELRFKYLSIIQIASAIMSGSVGVILAYAGYGILALVYHAIALSLSKAVLLIAFGRWVPLLKFSIQSIREIFNFGMSLLSTNLIKVIFNHIYTIVIGKMYSPTQVGYYNQANRFHTLSGNTLIQIIISVSYPALVKIREDIEKLKAAYKAIMQIVVFLLVPLLFALISISDEMFLLLLTDKWLSASPYFKLLSIYGLTLPLHLINVNVLKVFGDGKTIFNVELLRRIVLLIAILFTVKGGVTMLLIGQIIAMIPIIVVSMTVSGKYINYSFFEQMKDLIGFYVVGTVSFMLNYLIYYVLPLEIGILWTLILKAITFLFLYTLGILVFNRKFVNFAFRDIKRIVNLKKR